MNKIRISVAVATYNGERYIRQQMDSILEELSQDDEVILSDDGSVDKTLEIVEEYVNKDTRVHLIEGPGKGIKQNIANAIAMCRGNYIFLSDQDDVWVKGKVDQVMKYLGKNGCQLVLHDAMVMNEDLKETLMPSFFAYRGTKAGVLNNLWKNRYMGCCMSFDRKLLPLILPIPDEIEMHDQWIGIINDLSKGKTFVLNEKLLYYRRHGENVSDFNHGTLIQMLYKRFVFCKALFKSRRRRENVTNS